MINVNEKQIEGIFVDGLEITALYRDNHLIWEAISSNFISADGYAILTKDNKYFNGKE